MMDSTTKTTTAKPVSFPKSDATQAFRATAENSSTQAKEAFEKMSAATAEATALIKNSYSTEGAQDYSAKVIEFANANTEATFAFAQKLSGVNRHQISSNCRPVIHASSSTR
jgi:hypothetical protein